MPADKQFCNQTCRDNYLAKEKKGKKKNRIQMVVMFSMLGVLIIFTLFMG